MLTSYKPILFVDAIWDSGLGPLLSLMIPPQGREVEKSKPDSKDSEELISYAR